MSKQINLVASDQRAQSYGIRLVSETVHNFVGRRVHNPYSSHTLKVWENRAQAAEETCKHCARVIVNDPHEGWIDPEAGYDDEDGDGVWRVTCDEHDTFMAEHEPVGRYLDPNNHRVAERYSYLFSANGTMIAATPIARKPEGETLTLGDRVELSVNGYSLGEFEISAKSLHDPHLTPLEDKS